MKKEKTIHTIQLIQEKGYVRIGTNYYKIVQKPTINGGFDSKLVLWSAECIKTDFGRDYLKNIPKLDGFCLFPSHLNYQKVVGNFYNLYNEFNHTPMAGECEITKGFIKHIFREQYELGLDYIKLLLEQPLQKLPILCLISRERNTGKTTFLNFMKLIFGDNMTLNTNEEFNSNFNESWISSLLIAIDETFIERKQDSERLKNLSTAIKYKSEGKGKERSEVEFFGKFILCSNNEDNFVYIEPNETRYWVRKVMPFKKENIHLLSELNKEIPYFLHFLLNRPLSTKNESRMWFAPAKLQTFALQRLIQRNRSKIELELTDALLQIFDEKEVEKICFCPLDALNWLTTRGLRNINPTDIKRIVQMNWKLSPSPNSNAYTQYSFRPDGSLIETRRAGRFYQIDVKHILNFDETDETRTN